MLHGQVYFAILVVPIQLDFHILFAFKINHDIVVLADGWDPVVKVGFLGVFYAKDIDNQNKYYASFFVFSLLQNIFALILSLFI